jgi:hypothetical protein
MTSACEASTIDDDLAASAQIRRRLASAESAHLIGEIAGHRNSYS